MELRELGKTGLMVSRIGLGMAALGRPGYINLGHAEDLEKDYGNQKLIRFWTRPGRPESVIMMLPGLMAKPRNSSNPGYSSLNMPFPLL